MTEHTITIAGRDDTVTAAADQTMLDAMLRAGGLDAQLLQPGHLRHLQAQGALRGGRPPGLPR